ncbi:hypothetical protein QFC21_004518 [Naganishia friedmannii]|uniref:Uncharacterized protein n=1 Tax=Naganishia friedmannii TaxID=89922 RepID=A0ACC2VGS1_9TREE|nr:hypothetical protein QFC21_004518 [Naganishia friedmannii]
MSCQPTPITSWIQSSSTYETTQYLTSTRIVTTTVTTVVPVLNRWCSSSAAAAETTAADAFQPAPVLANNFAAPTPAPHSPTPRFSSPQYDYKTDRRFKDAHKHVNKPRSNKYHSPRARANKYPLSRSSQSKGEMNDTTLYKELIPRLDATADGCIVWATETQWITLQSTFTETIIDVATNTALATTQVWVPSVTTQDCVPVSVASTGVANVANQWKLNTAFTSSSASSATSTGLTGSTPAYPHAMAQPHIPTFIATASDSLATPQASSIGGLGVVASSVESDGVSSGDSQVSSKIAWGCGAVGATILIGILAWVIFDRRRKRQARRNDFEEEREILEEKRFFDDWCNEDEGDSNLPVAPEPFRQVALDPANEAMGDPEGNKNPRLMSRFSAGSSLREIYGLRGPVASAFIRPLSVFGQSRPKTQATADVASAKAVKLKIVSPRRYPEPTSDPSAKSPLRHALGLSPSGGSYLKIGSQSKAKSAIPQSGEYVGNHYRTVSRGKPLSIAALVPTMITEEPESESFSTLSPGPLRTGRSLTTAFSPAQRQHPDLLGMSGEGAHLQTPLEPVGRVLSVGEIPPYEEAEASRQVRALPNPKHESGWYTKSMRDWLPSSSHSRSVKGYAE